jgi:hypothetical protein
VKFHLDCIDYAEALLGGGAIDWGSPSAVSGLINKAQALLPSDIVILPVWRMLEALADPAAIAQRPREAQPLRTLLGNDIARAALLETVAMLSVSKLALGLPEPGEMAELAATLAGLSPPDSDADLIDDAAVYVADFLRIFAQTSVASVVLSEDSNRITLSALYAPIQKVALAYGWDYAVWNGVGDIWHGTKTVTIEANAKPAEVLAMVADLRG